MTTVIIALATGFFAFCLGLLLGGMARSAKEGDRALRSAFAGQRDHEAYEGRDDGDMLR